VPVLRCVNTSIRKVSISFLVCLVATIALNVQTSLGKENLTGNTGISSGGGLDNNNTTLGDQKFAALENEANNSNSNTSSNKFRNASLLNESTGQARMLGEFKALTQKKTGHLVPPPCTAGGGGVCLEQQKQLQLEQTPSSNQSSPSNGTLGPGLLSNLGKLNLTGQAQNENRTGGEEASKPSLSTKHPFNAQILSRILGEFKAPTQKLVPLQPVLPSNYKIKVTFDSVTVHNDHEGLYSGDGEYDLAVYVQGKKISLTDAGGSGGGLWDVGSGETVTFPAGTEKTVEVPSNLPLSILTVGSEVDGCDRTAFPEDVQSEIVRVLTLYGLRNIADDINDGINWIGCKLNPNDVLGVINKLYPPTSYGEGSHSEKSDAGDFTLRYTISVTPPTAPPTTTSSPSGQILGNLGQQKQLQLEQTPSSNQSSPSNGTLGPGLLSNLGKLNLTEQAQNENQTGGAEEASKPSLQLVRPLKSLSLADALGQTLTKVPKGKILTPLEGLSNTYKIKVTFDSVTVHDDHEGVFSGDGEYDLAVYVQGEKLSLTDAGGSGGGLWDVSSGETVTFPADTAVSVDVPGNIPLSIFTVGSEVDGCDRTAFPDDIKSIIVSIFTHTNPGYWAQGIINIHDYIEGRINWVGCKLNPNDSIGTVNEVYDPTAYGAGSHEEKSDAGDFTLRYSIAVTPPLPLTLK
jgi:hypothetical protein